MNENEKLVKGGYSVEVVIMTRIRFFEKWLAIMSYNSQLIMKR